MNNIICPRCKVSLIAEEYREHNCKKDFVRVQTIPIRTLFESSIDNNDDEVTMADGENGVLYRLVKCTHKIPHVLPDQPIGNTDKINRQGNSIPKQHIY